MKENTHLNDSIHESIPTKSKPCTVPCTVHTVHNEKRFPTEIRLRRTIHEVVKRYCGNSGITLGDFYEGAAILFMDLNPVEFFGVNLITPERRQQALDDQLREIVCIDELEGFIENVKTLRNGLHVSRKKEGIAILKNCEKINNRSERLEALIQEAIEYIKN